MIDTFAMVDKCLEEAILCAKTFSNAINTLDEFTIGLSTNFGLA